MTVMRTIQDDVNSLAMHVLDVADYASGVAAEAKDALTTEIEKVKADLAKAFDAKLEAFKKEIMGDVETEASKAVAELGSKVASLGKPATVESKPAPTPAPAPLEPVILTTPVVTEAPSGAVVTVDPVVGATTHEGADDTVTVLPHDGTDAHAHDAAMQPAEVKLEAVQEAVQATVDAGVAVPEKAEAPALEAAPVI